MKKGHIILSILTNAVIAFLIVFIGVFAFAEPKAIKSNNIINGCVYAGNTESNKVSLMINVYWGTEYIEPILKILKDENVKCTFFVGGVWVEKYPDVLKQIYDEGHEIASHGYSHKEHEKLSYDQNLLEMQKTHKLVYDAIGYNITLFAPPGGSYNKYTVTAADSLGYTTIMWTRDTIDWRDQNTELIYNRAINGIKGGDLILMHPKEKTVEALKEIIPYVKSKNLLVTTVSDTIS